MTETPINMVTKEQILNEIKRTAKENGDKPLGIKRFEKETGISRYDCNKYWSTFGEAQREAGFVANVLQVPHSEEFILESLVALTRELGRFPTNRDLIVKRNKDSQFPNQTSIHRRGHKADIVKKIHQYAMQKGYNDVVKICKVIIDKNQNERQELQDSEVNQTLGEVYLFKHGNKHYKIGKTNDTVRRGSELRIQLPESLDLIHSIKTDDPSGIEAYWHKRFEAKRMNGEWFNLNSSDIKAFRRWRKIY